MQQPVLPMQTSWSSEVSTGFLDTSSEARFLLALVTFSNLLDWLT